MVGTSALAASWGWGLYLVLWFSSASVLSRIGRARKAARVAGIVEKGNQRDAWQVLANGGVFLLCALLVICWPALTTSAASVIATAGAAALAAAGADTWSTEIGTWIGAQPWSLRTRSRVPTGTSGAVTIPGSLAGATGALALALLACLCLVIDRSAVVPVTLGGIAGAWMDTLIGAWWQSRRWCAICQQDTEQTVHDCGARTEGQGGLGRLDNDGVNLFCTIAGALTAMLLSRLLVPTV